MILMRSKNFLINNKTSRGFTLIELLMVVALVAVLGVSLYQALANGIRVWRHSAQVVLEEDATILLEKIAADLRQSFPFSTIPFKGTARKVSFAQVLNARVERNQIPRQVDYFRQPGRMEYYFDDAQKSVFRRQAGYGQAMAKKFAKPQLVAQNIESLRFRYYRQTSTGIELLDSVEKEFPVAVKVIVTVVDAQGNSKIISRLINLPVQVADPSVGDS